MNGWEKIDQFLTTDPHDVGCEQAMRLLHVYVDLAIEDRVEAARRYPGLAAHLIACGPCEQDFEGLLLAVQAALDTGNSGTDSRDTGTTDNRR